MMTLRALVAGLLALCLTAASMGAAFAVGQAPARDRIVLCTGHGLHAVYVDETGAPTNPPELCADSIGLPPQPPHEYFLG